MGSAQRNTHTTLLYFIFYILFTYLRIQIEFIQFQKEIYSVYEKKIQWIIMDAPNLSI